MTIETREQALLALGFSRESNPRAEEIKKAYRENALKYHPDKNKSPEAYTQFIAIGEAFHFLSQPQSPDVFEEEAFSFEKADALFTQLFGGDFNFDRFFDLAFEEKNAPYRMKVRTVFHNEKIHFTSRLTNLSTFYIENEEDLNRQCQKKFANINKLTIFNDELNLPQNGAVVILRHLLENQKIIKVDYQKDFFSAIDESMLQKHLDKNNTPGKNNDRKKRERLTALVGMLVGLMLFALMSTGGSVVALLGVAILGGIGGYVIAKAHQTYLKLAASYYSQGEIEAIHVEAEQAALLAGLKAKKLGNYLSSFKNKITYQHPFAFAAGLFYAFEHNISIKKLIKTMFIKAKPIPLIFEPSIIADASSSFSTIPAYRMRVSMASEKGHTGCTILFSDQNDFQQWLQKDLTQFSLHEDENNILPENGTALIVEALLKERALVSATFPPHFLNEAQNTALQVHLEENKRNQTAKKQRVTQREKEGTQRWVIVGTSLAIATAFLTGQGYFWILYYGGLAGFFSYQMRKIYTLLAKKYYQRDEILSASSPSEQKALQLGVEALFWGDYSKKLLQWEIYRHPIAFITGLRHAEKENEERVSTI